MRSDRGRGDFPALVLMAMSAVCTVIAAVGLYSGPPAQAAPVPHLINDNPGRDLKPSSLLQDFGDKTEEELVKEFDERLPALLEARLEEELKPQIMLPHGRNETSRMQLVSVDVENRRSVWQTTVAFARFENSPIFAYTVDYLDAERHQHRFLVDDLPPAEVYQIISRLPADTQDQVRFAMWLWAKGERELSNAQFTRLAMANRVPRNRVEHWLCAKYGWDVPEADEDGSLLRVLELHDLDNRRDYQIMLTTEARREFVEGELTERANAEVRNLHELLHGSRRSPGTQVALDTLKHRLDRFDQAFGITGGPSGRAARQLEDIRSEVDRRIRHIESNFYPAQRLRKDEKFEEAAAALSALLALDPMNRSLLDETAQAYIGAAELQDGGRRVGNRAYARRAAELYDRESAIYPMVLSTYNAAGRAWFAAGDRRQAQARLNTVLDRFDYLENPTENQVNNREFAAAQLRHMGITPRDPNPRRGR
jgi:tetratricopeptide (TPR) repeat protein